MAGTVSAQSEAQGGGSPQGHGLGDGGGGGQREGDKSDVAPAAVWRHSAQPGRGSCIRCVRWNWLRALKHQTPNLERAAQQQLPGFCGSPFMVAPFFQCFFRNILPMVQTH